MKKGIVFIICIILCCSLASCSKSNYYSNNNTYQPLKDNNYDNSQGSPNTTSSVPYQISFKSVKEIEKFIKAALDTDNEYNEYKQKNIPSLLLPKVAAEQMANYINGIYFPIPPSNIDPETTTMSCSLSNCFVFSVFYEIDGIRYRFNTSSADIKEISYSDYEFVDNISVGEHTVNMYRGENSLLGNFIHEYGQTGVLIFSKDIQELPDIAFEFTAIE